MLRSYRMCYPWPSAAIMCMACFRAQMTADRFSRAAFSEPDRLMIRLRPRIPATARDNMARGVIFSPSIHMATGMARISRSSTARVASGVTSRGERPVPPAVMIRSMCRWSAQSRSAALICACSSGTMAVCVTEKPASSSMARTAGPLLRAVLPEGVAAAEGETVRFGLLTEKCLCC